MVNGGTKIYCPGCESEEICRAISPTKLQKSKAQRVSNEQYGDIHWFRRGRECLNCGHKFLTGELEESLINELVDLRNAWLYRIKGQAVYARWQCAARSRIEAIPLSEAQNFIREVAYWDHPTGYLAHAPKHASRVKRSNLGWGVTFGANTFLPGMAIARCNKRLEKYFESIRCGKVIFYQDVIRALQIIISGCVATQDGYEYNGFYPLDGGKYLTFGTQLIDTYNGALFILKKADPKGLFIRKAE